MSEPDSTLIPYGYCHCGCGQKAPVVTKTDSKRSVLKGDVLRYKRGHHPHTDPNTLCPCGCGLTGRECRTASIEAQRTWWRINYPHIPYGSCCCGCGRKTDIAPRTKSERYWTKGEPKPFLHGHNAPMIPTAFHGVNRNEGLCECGCGEPASIAKYTSTRGGFVRGKPRRFLPGHISKFTSKILRSEAYFVDRKTGCWIWQLSRNAKGYGTVWHEGRCWLAHRLSFTLANGPIPSGLSLDHLCRNPPCVNPSHLEVVTHAENVRRGIRSKLTWHDVHDIRQTYAQGGITHKELATLHGVHFSTIGRITRRVVWTKP